MSSVKLGVKNRYFINNGALGSVGGSYCWRGHVPSSQEQDATTHDGTSSYDSSYYFPSTKRQRTSNAFTVDSIEKESDTDRAEFSENTKNTIFLCGMYEFFSTDVNDHEEEDLHLGGSASVLSDLSFLSDMKEEEDFSSCFVKLNQYDEIFFDDDSLIMLNSLSACNKSNSDNRDIASGDDGVGNDDQHHHTIGDDSSIPSDLVDVKGKIGPIFSGKYFVPVDTSCHDAKTGLTCSTIHHGTTTTARDHGASSSPHTTVFDYATSSDDGDVTASQHIVSSDVSFRGSTTMLEKYEEDAGVPTVTVSSSSPLDTTEGRKTKIILTDKDVIFGRGYAANRHPGNALFRKLVEATRPLYLAQGRSKKGKNAVSKQVMESVYSYGGRFLEVVNASYSSSMSTLESGAIFVEVDKKRVRKKCSQRLREKRK